jgi:hypothetical protein
MPKHWQQSSGEITAQRTNFEKMIAGVDNLYRANGACLNISKRI